jgi:hypothetical protein
VTRLTARVDADGADAALLRTVLASIPNHYQLTDGPPDVVVMSSDDESQIADACRDAVKAVVLDRPGRLPPHTLKAIAETAGQHGCLLAPAARFAPTLPAAPELFDCSSVDLLECTISSHGGLSSSLVEQLALVRALLGEVKSIHLLQRTTTHYVVDATIADHPRTHALLNGLTSPLSAEEATIRAVGPQAHLALRLNGGCARPAEITRYDGVGARSPWPSHQHAHRATLTRLHTVLTTGVGELPYPFEALSHDARLAGAVAR